MGWKARHMMADHVELAGPHPTVRHNGAQSILKARCCSRRPAPASELPDLAGELGGELLATPA